MGVFNKTNKHSTQNGATVVAQGTCLIGGITTKGTVHIDGKFEGVILEADVITIGITGVVIGDIKANNLMVSGVFDGNIDCNQIQILPEGKVIGNIQYNELIIDPNGSFEGQGVKKNSSLKSKYKEVENKIGNIIMGSPAFKHEKS